LPIVVFNKYKKVDNLLIQPSKMKEIIKDKSDDEYFGELDIAL